MRTRIPFVIALLSICIGNSLQAQSLRDILIPGNWAPSVNPQILDSNSSLILLKVDNDGDRYMRFKNDSTLETCQERLHPAGISIHPVYYVWSKSGRWGMVKYDLKLALSARILICRVDSVSATKIKLVVKRVSPNR